MGYALGEKVPKSRRIYAVVKGEEMVRLDVLRLFERKLTKFLREVQEDDDKRLTKMVVFLEKGQDLSRFTYDMSYDLKVFYWKEKILEESVAIDFIERLRNGNSWIVIMDGSNEISDLFKKVCAKRSTGLLIDCSQIPGEFEEYIPGRLSCGNKVEVQKEALSYLVELPYLSLFNIFNVLEALGIENVSMNVLRQFKLLKEDIEAFLVLTLLEKGKRTVLRYNLKNVNGGRFFGLLYWYLVLLLRMKTMADFTSVQASSKLGIKLKQYKEVKELKDKFKLKELYQKLYLVLSLMCWRRKYGALLLLLMYW